MSDLSKIIKGSPRSNIAANFQNVSLTETVPPIGVFWDIENCQVPKGKSAIALVQNIRQRFFAGYREAEFMCVCDISKERKEIIQELNLAQVTVVHINATSKNAADDKLKQCMRRFVDTHGNPATIVLISGDVNFATDLSDFRHRHNIRILLVHGSHAPEPLLTCAHEHFSFSELTDYLPYRSPVKNQSNRCELTVRDLPVNRDPRQIQNRLRQLSDNCGGRVVTVSGNVAILRFPSADAAQRARKRMDNEDVFGNKIAVTFAQRSAGTEYREESPQKAQSKSFKAGRQSNMSSGSSRESSPGAQRGFEISESNGIGSCSKLSHCRRHFDFPPPPDFISQDHLNDAKQAIFPETQDEECSDLGNDNNSENFSMVFDNDYEFTRTDDKQFGRRRRTWSTSSGTPQFSDHSKSRESSPFVQPDKEINIKKGRGTQKNIGRVSPFLMSEGSAKQLWTSSAANQTEDQKENITSCDGSESYSSHFQVGTSKSPVFLSHLSRFAEYQSYSLPWSSSLSFSSEGTQLVGRASPVMLCNSSPVELLVTNLDQNFEVNEMKSILLSIFREHVMVLHISMVLQSDGNPKAIIKVPSLQDAQYAISQLHRRKIGYKRILISYASCEKSPPLHVLRSEVLALLNDIPSKSLPLFKFRELFEKRYHRSISVSELYKMREAICVQEDSSGRTVYLNPDYRNTPSPADSDSSQEVLQVLEKPYCERHFHILESRGWAEQESVYPLPNVHISLKTLAPRVHTLLDSHQGSLPLNSFCACYKAEFGPLPVDDSENEDRTHHADNTDHILQTILNRNSFSQDVASNIKIVYHGVPLEHLIACIPGVQITKSYLGIKKVQWLENKPVDLQGTRSISPALAGQLSLFSREVVDLLKGQSRSSIQFGKFIPAYHHHFGRQCRVADYGFTKLIDLLESIPHVVQILGQGHNRMLTLTHRSQVKRFAGDFLRILKSQPNKQISLKELPVVYERCVGKKFEITDYGVCDVGDMLAEVSENSVVITLTEDDVIISIPKREQTPEERERTKQFSTEVIELIRHTPNCSMPFSKFIPSYHHHFGRQCRVSDYGFSKLIELFEAIPDILEISGLGEDKLIHLTQSEKYKVLAERLLSVVRSAPHHILLLNQLSAMYTKIHGHILRPQDFGGSTLRELLEKLRSSIKVVEGPAGTILTLVDRGFVHQTSLKIRWILMEQLDGKITVDELCQRYCKKYGYSINLTTLKEFGEVIKIEDNIAKLTPLQLLVRDLIILLHEHDGHMPIQNVEAAFVKRFGAPCHPVQYGFPSLLSLFQSEPDYFLIRGRRNKRMVLINRESAGTPLPFLTQSNTFMSDEIPENETIEYKIRNTLSEPVRKPGAVVPSDEPALLRMGNSPVDLLNQPIPSGLPSPELEPEPNLISENDLMGFESPLPTNQDVMVTVNEHEHQQLKTPPLSEQASMQSPCTDSGSLLKTLLTGSSGPYATPAVALQCNVMTSLKTIPSHCAFPGFHQQPSVMHLISNSPVSQIVPSFSPVVNSLEGKVGCTPESVSSKLLLSQSSTVPPQAVSTPSLASSTVQLSEEKSPKPSLHVSTVQNSLFTDVGENFYNDTLPSFISSSFTVSDCHNVISLSQKQKTRPDSISYEDLTSVGNSSLESGTSSQSTPTRGSIRMRTRSRIAAQFSIPLE